jgi:uncharacterized protein (TIGR02058 family)
LKWEVAGLSHPNEMLVEVRVAVPFRDQVRQEEVLAVLPSGQKTLVLKDGGTVVVGRAIPELDDKNDDMNVAIAAVTVSIPGRNPDLTT